MTTEHKKVESVKHAPPPFEQMTDKQRLTQLEKLADRLERMRIGDYVNNLNKTSRIIWLGLLSGIARGVGLTIGATLVIAIIFKIIAALVSMNVPYLSDMMKEVEQTLQTRYGPRSMSMPARDAAHIPHRR